MSEESPKSKLSQLLERLQEESWQLELLITGFAIFLVAGSKEAIWRFVKEMEVLLSGTDGLVMLTPFVAILIASWLILLINLILHVFIRGLWISAIGLRYVSDDIDFEELNFAPKYDQFLKKQIPSFDAFIEKLEKLASIVFAFTFIIIFMIISLGMFILLMMGVVRILEATLDSIISEQMVNYITRGIVITLVVFAMVYFFDFISLGRVKKIKFLQKFYYPIYRFYGWVTLAFLYRPLYYNLIDNSFGRKIGFLLFPYLIIVTTVTSIQVDSFLYFPKRNSNKTLQNSHYDDRTDMESPQLDVSIPSKYIDQDFLELFIPYNKNDDESIEAICPGIIADKSVGVKFNAIQFSSSELKITSIDSVLLCNSLIHQVMINDSVIEDPDFMFYNKPAFDEKGIIATIDIGNLDKGKHLIRVEKRRLSSDSLYWQKYAEFPFWKTD